MNKSAVISKDNNYRYLLERRWDDSLKMIMFIMLNPSTADSMENDATINRCIRYAQAWGYGGIIVCNIFAYRSRNPLTLLEVEDPYGPMNYHYIQKTLKRPEIVEVICAWGNSKVLNKVINWDLDLRMATKGYKLGCLGLNQDGTPKHPLYLPSSTITQNFVL